MKFFVEEKKEVGSKGVNYVIHFEAQVARIMTAIEL